MSRLFVPFLTCGLLLGVAAPVLSHPFGPPPSAIVSARGRSVFVEWTSAADDAIAIGVHVGLLPEESIEAYMEGATQVAPSAADEERLSRSEELREYLLEHIEVFQDGEPCAGTVQPITDFVYSGATVVHECPDPVEAVDLRVAMLHDVHEAYRTFAVSTTRTDPGQAVYSLASPVHTWTFPAVEDAEVAPAGGGIPAGAVVGGAVVLMLLAGVVVLVGRSGGRA